MRRQQPTRDWSDWAILTGLFFLLASVMALVLNGAVSSRAIGRPKGASAHRDRQKSLNRSGESSVYLTVLFRWPS